MHNDIPLPIGLNVEENRFVGMGWTRVAYVGLA